MYKPYQTLCSIFYDLTKKFAAKKEVDFYASFIEKNPGRILEAMSGSGRLQIPLLQRGYTVDGVDNSSIMLDRCKERCSALRLTPHLYEQSIENLDLPHLYSTITIAVGSFQLLSTKESATKALKKLHQHMNKKSSLLIDTFIPSLTEEPVSIRTARIDDTSFIRLTTRYLFDTQKRKADALSTYDLIKNGIREKTEEEILTVTWYEKDELSILCEENGLRVENIYQESFRPGILSTIFHIRQS